MLASMYVVGTERGYTEIPFLGSVTAEIAANHSFPRVPFRAGRPNRWRARVSSPGSYPLRHPSWSSSVTPPAPHRASPAQSVIRIRAGPAPYT